MYLYCVHFRTMESDEAARLALKDNGSDSGVDSDTHRTNNDSSLDKAYWIHRAAEVWFVIYQYLFVHKYIHSIAINAASTI